MELKSGQNTPLTARNIAVRISQVSGGGIDLIAVLLGAEGQVDSDADFVFYNAPQHASGAVALTDRSVVVDLCCVPVTVRSIVVAANTDSGYLGRITVWIDAESTSTFAPRDLDNLPTAILIEVYRRGDGWRLRALGQGWTEGLAGLAREYGVQVDDQPECAVEEQPITSMAGLDDTSLASDLRLQRQRRDDLTREIELLEDQVRQARASIVETDELRLLQQVGYYQFRHPLDDILASKQHLGDLQKRIKAAITQRTAVSAKSGWMVNGSLREGAVLVRQFSDLMLRTYNIEADNCVRTVRAHSLPTVVQRLERTREAILKNGSTMGVAIDDGFHALRLEELQLTADHHLRVEAEKERAREERQQVREEAKAQEEFKRRKKDILKEQAHYQSLLERSRANGDEVALTEARERLAELAENLEEVAEMAANTRVGYVYVISNVGAFGDRVVKIGMTRREDPLQRVYELGSASVPFKFDVHALVFSQDAVALESELHRTFDEQRVNRVNRRREFFRVSLPEVRTAFDRIATGHVVEFREIAEAPEWRQSQVPYSDHRSGVDLTRGEGRHGSS